MPIYRVIRFVVGGRIQSSWTIDEPDDFAAIDSILESEAFMDCEIWRNDRLVARLPAAPERAMRRPPASGINRIAASKL